MRSCFYKIPSCLSVSLFVCISGVFLQNTNENLKTILLLAVLANKVIECDISIFLKNWLVKFFCFAGSYRNIKFYNGLKKWHSYFLWFFLYEVAVAWGIKIYLNNIFKGKSYFEVFRPKGPEQAQNEVCQVLLKLSYFLLEVTEA